MDAALLRLHTLRDVDAMTTAREGGWTRKEELGHLIDSSVNNHIRFVFAALEGEYTGPAYQQNGWVDLHGYKEMDWADLVDSWYSSNMLLVRVVKRIPEDRLNTVCRVGEYEPMTLQALIEDYLDHMQGHLTKILPSTYSSTAHQ